MDKLRKVDGWSVRPIEHRTGAAFIRQYHYAKGCSNTSTLAAGLFDPDGNLVGVALWMPPLAGVVGWARRQYGSKNTVVLSRMAILDSVPRNGASFLLARSLRLLRRKGYDFAVTYADPGQGHDGHVYTAAGWTRDGESVAHPRWVDSDGRQRSAKATRNLSVSDCIQQGWARQPGHRKPRYVRRISCRGDAAGPVAGPGCGGAGGRGAGGAATVAGA